MKKFLLTLVAFNLLTTFCSAQVVGKISGGKPVLTADPIVIIQKLQKNLLELSNISAAFDGVQIAIVKTHHYLVFTGKDLTTKLELLVVNNKLEAQRMACSTKTSAVVDGCEPNWAEKSCSSCSGDCTKTTFTGWLLE